MATAVPPFAVDETLARRQRAERSRTVLDQRFPELAARLTEPAIARPVDGAEGVIDLAFGDGRYYGGDGRALASGQVDAWLAQPVRVRAPPPYQPENSESAIERDFLTALHQACRQVGVAVDTLPVYPIDGDPVLVVVGLGLGFHLQPLIERLGVRRVILLETHIEFVRQSLAVVDWDQVLAMTEGRGGRLWLLIGDAGESLLNTLAFTLIQAGTMAVDGAYLFLHHGAPPLVDTYRRLPDTAALAHLPKGFFEDELLMLTNAATNLGRHDFRLVAGDRKRHRRETVYLIASGPSLDQDLPEIRRRRQGAVVISCGSALQPTLAAGIVPDYHAEVENVAAVYQVLSLVAGRFDLKPITLLAAVTVDPRCAALFGDALLFFRDSSVPAGVFAQPGQEFALTGPNVTNGGLRLALALGFRRFVLFGIDCGSRGGARKHATGTAYETDGVAPWYEPSLRFFIPVPANFGGTSHTDLFLGWSRKVLGAIVARFGVQAVNCSDGAAIEGVPACRAAELPAPGSALDRARVKAEVAAGLATVRAGQLIDPNRLQRLLADGDGLFSQMLARIDTALAAAPGVKAFEPAWTELSALTTGPAADANLVVPMVRGALDALGKYALFVVTRLPEDTRRREIERHLLESLSAILDGCRQRLRALCQDLLATTPPTTPPTAS